ncbi:MAG: anaerobic magnesium-protoporphyrin IX monomethyl ester cyclase [Planctomycetota bacterium]|jgi:anaerobic magnesium-protoporphyrin IX monomethyl ester cyclase
MRDPRGMRTALVFPPQGHFTQPYLSLPSLAAYLKQNGYDDVHQLDVNIDAYDHFLSKERLELSLERIAERGELERLESQEQLSFSDMTRYQLLSEVGTIGHAIAGSIEEAKAVVRSPQDFYDYKRYIWAGRTIEQGLRIFSEEYAPTRLTAHGFVMRHRIERSAEIVTAISDEAENPYIEYFREVTLPALKELDPDLIGISLTFPSQAIPAFTLARLVKEWKPEVHITVGGGLMAYVAEKLSHRAEIWDLIDSMVLLEGERPLLQLCEHVEGKRELSEITNLIYRGPDGKPIKTSQIDPLNIMGLPTPDFSDLPLKKYFTPELVMPLAATRGCYWGKCVFCTLYTVIGPGYRGRTVEQTVEDMRELQNLYGVKSFYLAIEDLPPNMAKRFPEAIIEAGLDISWWADARFEHEVFDEETCKLLAQSGCKRLAFGYESSSNRVLELMCKGIDPDESLKMIRRVHDAGISVTLYAMVGFPTETREEALATLNTVLANRDWIQEVSVRVFYLDESSEVYKRREEFDIVEVYPDPEADLQVYYDFKASSGMSRPEARQLYLQFTEALRSHFPVFQNTNMLYHELKSHYFLYLARFGSFERMVEEVLEPALQKDGGSQSETLRSVDGLVTRELAFDREIIDQTVNSIDSATIRPRYQSDLFEPQDLLKLDAEVPPLERAPSVLVYDPRSGEVQTLSQAAYALLERCDGTRDADAVVEIIPEAHRAAAAGFLLELARSGLLVESPYADELRREAEQARADAAKDSTKQIQPIQAIATKAIPTEAIR